MQLIILVFFVLYILKPQQQAPRSSLWFFVCYKF